MHNNQNTPEEKQTKERKHRRKIKANQKNPEKIRDKHEDRPIYSPNYERLKETSTHMPSTWYLYLVEG
jgi:hypothetical protein